MILNGFQVNLNPLFEEAELRSCLALSDTKALILRETTPDRSFYAILNKVVLEISESDYQSPISSKTLPSLSIIIAISEKKLK